MNFAKSFTLHEETPREYWKLFGVLWCLAAVVLLFCAFCVNLQPWRFSCKKPFTVSGERLRKVFGSIKIETSLNNKQETLQKSHSSLAIELILDVSHSTKQSFLPDLRFIFIFLTTRLNSSSSSFANSARRRFKVSTGRIDCYYLLPFVHGLVSLTDGQTRSHCIST